LLTRCWLAEAGQTNRDRLQRWSLP